MVREIEDDEELKEVDSVNHYTGGDKCQYRCGCVAGFVVSGVTTHGGVTFIGCRDCLRDARIYPIDNGWVDERTDAEVNA